MSKFIVQVRLYLALGRRLNRNYSEPVEALVRGVAQRIVAENDGSDPDEVLDEVRDVLIREKKSFGVDW
jgi:hypothetical protein